MSFELDSRSRCGGGLSINTIETYMLMLWSVSPCLHENRVRRWISEYSYRRKSEHLNIPSRGDIFTLAISGTAFESERWLGTVNLWLSLRTPSEASCFSERYTKTHTLWKRVLASVWKHDLCRWYEVKMTMSMNKIEQSNHTYINIYITMPCMAHLLVRWYKRSRQNCIFEQGDLRCLWNQIK